MPKKYAEPKDVIFRREYNPYTEEWDYLAVLPNTPASFGKITVLCFRESAYNDGRYLFDSFDEADYWYLMDKTKIIHKNDPIIPELTSALSRYLECPVRVREKIMR